MAVAALEYEKVYQMDCGAAEHEEQGEPVQRGPPDKDVDGNDGCPEYDC